MLFLFYSLDEIVLAELCQYLTTKVPSIEGIIDHSTISPKMKTDVKKGKDSDVFPWDKFISLTEMTDYTGEPYETEIKKYFKMA